MKGVRVFLVVGLAFLWISGQAVAQGLAEDPRVASALEVMKTWLEAQRAYGQIPGISAAIVHDQRALWSGGFGSADVERHVPAGPDTIYSICSISKLFTSISVMQLRDAGKIRLDDPVAKYLPWFKIQQTAPEGPEITVEGLLTHASGLPRESDYPYWTGPDFKFPSHEEIVERIAKQQTVYPAETYFHYSNLGLTLAGEIVAAVSGMPYAEYVRKNIIEPLGLTSTTPEMPEGERGARLATGYGIMTREGRRDVMPFFQARGIAPAAGFASTAEDLARFAQWQFRVLNSGITEVLKANTLREMYRVHWVEPDFETVWGLGFEVMRNDGRTFVGHGGNCPGFRTAVLLKVDEKVAAVFMCNAMGVNSEEIAEQMYEIVGPKIKDAVKNPSASKPIDPDLIKYTGVYTSAWGEVAMIVWEGGLAAMNLPTMTPVKDIQKLKKTGDNTFRRVLKDEALGEEIVFRIGPGGRAERIKWNSNFYDRTR